MQLLVEANPNILCIWLAYSKKLAVCKSISTAATARILVLASFLFWRDEKIDKLYGLPWLAIGYS